MNARTTADAQRRGIRQGVDGILATVTVVLHDKYGWKPHRIVDFHRKVNKQWGAVLEGRVSVDDLSKLANEILEEVL